MTFPRTSSVQDAHPGGAEGARTGRRLSNDRTVTRRFDSLEKVEDHPIGATGLPELFDTSLGPAMKFDGVHDALFVPGHPLAMSEAFTAEVVPRPEGGALEQRFLHLDPVDSPDLAPGSGRTRILFENRVVDRDLYLDAFICGDGYQQALMAPDELHPVGLWHHVAQTYDGQVVRPWVNGVPQLEAAVPFMAQADGRASVGMRLNGITQVNGAMHRIRFTPEVLAPSDFTLDMSQACR